MQYNISNIYLKCSTVKTTVFIMAAARGTLQRMYLYYLFYILLRGSMSVELSLGIGSLSCSLAVGKSLTQTEIPTNVRIMQKQAETPMRIKMAKVCQLVECCSLAALVLLSGDVSPKFHISFI